MPREPEPVGRPGVQGLKLSLRFLAAGTLSPARFYSPHVPLTAHLTGSVPQILSPEAHRAIAVPTETQAPGPPGRGSVLPHAGSLTSCGPRTSQELQEVYGLLLRFVVLNA